MNQKQFEQLIADINSAYWENEPGMPSSIRRILDVITKAGYHQCNPADIEIGQTIRRRLVSMNGIPVSRATISASEVEKIDQKWNGVE